MLLGKMGMKIRTELLCDERKKLVIPDAGGWWGPNWKVAPCVLSSAMSSPALLRPGRDLFLKNFPRS